jgi:hypothetical protein
LLCDECEGRIQRFEDAFCESWMKYLAVNQEVPEGSNAVLFRCNDYARFKLFHLSVLWRCAIAASQDFRDFKLGPHEDRLRTMLLSEVAGRSHDYSLIGAVILRPSMRRVHAGVVSAFGPLRIQAHRAYSLVYAGCLWTVIVSRHASLEVDPFILREDGTMLLPLCDLRELRGLWRAAARGYRAQLERQRARDAGP